MDDHAAIFTQRSGHSQEGDLIYDCAPPHGTIVGQPGSFPHHTVNSRLLHDTSNTKTDEKFRLREMEATLTGHSRVRHQVLSFFLLCRWTIHLQSLSLQSPATQSFNALLFFREFRFVVLCDFQGLESDVRVILFHSNHHCRVPDVSDIHVNSSDHNHTGRGAGCAGQTGDRLGPLRCKTTIKFHKLLLSYCFISLLKIEGGAISNKLFLILNTSRYFPIVQKQFPLARVKWLWQLCCTSVQDAIRLIRSVCDRQLGLGS